MAEGVNVRIPERLKNFVEQQAGPDGLYQSPSEYVRDLIRRDYEQQEAEKWAWLKAELAPGMAASDDAFIEVTAEEIIREAKARRDQK
jgi:antitoxin ParD1/3/4